MTQEQLTVKALAEAHPFQKAAMLDLMAKRWRVNSVNYHPRTGARLVVMRHEGDSRAGIAVYPDGSGARSSSPTVKWDWSRVERAAEAVVPDASIKHLIPA
jgi:hypothetical protein